MKNAYSNAAAASAGLDRHVPAARPVHGTRGLFGTLFTWQSRIDDRQRLRELDDRLLADMGITRTDALHESRKPFWKE
jgi:uncharacterized protein YjiS (DUF1127 family)